MKIIGTLLQQRHCLKAKPEIESFSKEDSEENILHGDIKEKKFYKNISFAQPYKGSFQ